MKNSLVAKITRWAKATVITVLLGLSGATCLQPNALSLELKW